MSLIKIKNVSVSYKAGYKTIFALKNINFDINAGEYVCIVGNNGSGKSTLIKSILRLLPVSSGQISINCQKDEISYLPQSNIIPDDFPATVEEIVLSGTQNANMKIPFYRIAHKKLAKEAMEKTDIIKYTKRRFGELSGGQQQRVMLARAIAKKPKFLVLDEPCTGLDSTASKGFYELLKKINCINKTTIVMVSHDLLAVNKYASKIVELNNEILFCGSLKDWMNFKSGEAVI